MPEDLRSVSLKIAKYKCFGDEPQGFDHLPPFTLIIGRNNTGKSALLDLLSYIVTGDLNVPLTLDSTRAAITISAPITEQDCTHVSGVPASELVGQQIRWRMEEDHRSRHLVDPNPPRLSPRSWSEIGPLLLRYKRNPFREYKFRRLNAERNIEPEVPGTAAISDHGAGTTRTVHHFLHSAARQQEALVEVDILRDLNTIFGADGTFTRIATREIAEGKVELYLDETTKGRIPLSRSGSGLKTVLLVLVLLHLIPALERSDPSAYLYGFEELENNLHPALQRRLLRFLRATSEERHCRFFLTTHSPVDIDYFARDPNAQVLHVTHDRRNAVVTTVSDYLRGRNILDDLDLRASDILQANGIIWVEGPSDRLYLNRWIELWTDRALREGAHYQVLQYGGSLMVHLNAEPPDQPTDTIHILTVNRNVAVLLDSDKRNARDILKPTATRITQELARVNGYAWTTAGRTVENYLPDPLQEHLIGRRLPRYADVVTAIAKKRRASTTDKVRLARETISQLTRADLARTLDLAERLEELCARIRQWNGT